MKKMKRLLSVLLVAVLVLANVQLPTAAADTETGTETDIRIKIGESVELAGKMDADSVPDTSVISVTEASYASHRAATLEDLENGGNFLIVTGSRYALNTNDGSGTWPQAGRGLTDVSSSENSDFTDLYWQIEKYGNGYSIKNCTTSQYLNFNTVSGNGCNVTMSSNPQELQIAANGSNYQISCVLDSTTYYLNNYGDDNIRMAGWTTNAASFQFWKQDNVITGLQAGTTELSIDGVTYTISVVLDERNVNLRIGESVTYEGALQENTAQAVAEAENSVLYSYAAVDEIVSGKYLIVNNHQTKIVTNESVSISGEPEGLNVASADWADNQANYEAYMWTVTAVDGGYTIQDADGKYLGFEATDSYAAKAVLYEDEKILTITEGDGDIFFISDGTYNLNNYENDDDNMCGYYDDDSGSELYFYQMETTPAVTITGSQAGRTDITIGDTLYHVRVVRETTSSKECYIKAGETLNITDATADYTEEIGTYDNTIVKVSAVLNDANGTDITFEGVAEGRAVVEIGATKYYVYVSESAEDVEETEEVVIYVGQTKTLVSENNGSTAGIKGENFDQYLANYSFAGMGEDLLAVRGDVTDTINGIAAYYVGEVIDLSECLYTFHLNEDGTYNVSGTAANGAVVYLDPEREGEACVNTAQSDAKVEILFNEDETISINDVRDGSDDYYLNLSEAHILGQGNAESKFSLYRVADENEVSSTELPGYVKVTEIEDGEQYVMIASHTHDSAICYYAIYPTLENGAYAQAVRVTDQVLDHSHSEATITGMAEGETTLTVEHKTYHIAVKNVPETLTADATPFVSETGSSAGHALTKLTISADNTFNIDFGNGYTGDVTWSIENQDETVADWANISSEGVITAADASDHVNTYEGYIVAAMADGTEYKIPIKVTPAPILGTASSRRYDVYLDKIYHTEIYYGWIYEYTFDTTSENPELLYGSTELTQAIEGETIYINISAARANGLDFFAKPEDGYALTHMGSTGTAGHYKRLEGNSPEETEFITSQGVAGYNQYNGINQKATTDLVQRAMDAGCDGAQGFTRYANGSGVSSVLSYRSEKLPTVEKEVMGILGADAKRESYRTYAPGMTASRGEYVYFSVKVETYDSEEQITYSNVILEDLLKGAQFYEKDTPDTIKPTVGMGNTRDITADINGDGLEGQVHEYYVVYQIQAEDVASVEHSITNTVNLTYDYRSGYSTGTYGGSANDIAEILITDVLLENIVVDFGLPVVCEYQTVDVYFEIEKQPEYGTVDVEVSSTTSGENTIYKNKITYTPTTMLQGIDVVTLQEITSTSEAEEVYHSFYVYPATTVYYEEGFAEYTGAWDDTGSKGSGTQAYQDLEAASEEAIDNELHYGYDAKYAAEVNGPSNGTEAVSTAAGNDAVFTFTGSGVDIYANCASQTGTASILVRDQDNNNAIKKLVIVNTKMAGEGAATSAQNGMEAYHIPIASINDMGHSTYAVAIRHTRTAEERENDTTYPLKLDGFRVYNTLESSAPFAVHNEADPNFVEMRNAALNALSVTSDTSEDYAQDIAAGFTQVFAQNEDGQGITAVVLDSGTNYYTSENAQDILDNGPKNEIFLYGGQSLVFKLSAGLENVQIGMKAASGSINVKVQQGEEYLMGTAEAGAVITSSTDMFYSLGDMEEETTITITNNGEGVLSITDLKYFAGTSSASALAELSEEDLMPALYSMGFRRVVVEEVPEETPEAISDDTTEVTPEVTPNGTTEETQTVIPEEVTVADDEMEETDSDTYGETIVVTEETDSNEEETEEGILLNSNSSHLGSWTVVILVAVLELGIILLQKRKK